ncbi:neutral zinc metallopeptidase [Actinomadura macrotermitis]|uniref:Metalloprotease n=1 Tax=Actinomadura macrotermitis TaxID=2585200 RepID=A0A7K0BTD6_9ACTN|nr:neutral zinc metallopeptidase [Actinomadura macrotermitis]MQY04407.1 hypothetical protein [Actinomadura macrotermitis]
MAGHQPPWGPPPAPPPAPPQVPPYGLPSPGPGYGPRYQYVPARRPPRRSAGGTIAGIIGALAVVGVLTVLGLTAFGRVAGGAGAGPGAGGGPVRQAAAGTDRKLYASGSLTSVRCRLPAIAAGAESMRRFMNTLSDCLDGSWKSQFGRIGAPFDPPRRVFWEQPGRSPCGNYPSPGASAFYCPANNTMYVGLRDVVATSGDEPLSHYAVFARVIAHEYGHHVQDSAGILERGNRLMQSEDVTARNEASRRIELQAQCLAGAFLGAERDSLPMTRAQYEALMADVRGRGDDRRPVAERDHGSGRHYAGWVARGFRGRGLGVCNTWTVPASAVS